MAQAAALPAGWTKILDEIRRHLDDAVAATDARISAMPVFDAGSSFTHQQTFTETCLRLQGLGDRLRSAEQIIEATDKVLQAEESLLQQHQRASRRLCDWAAGRGAR